MKRILLLGILISTPFIGVHSEISVALTRAF